VLKLAKLTWFDTHVHLQDKAFSKDRAQVFARAKKAGVDYILLATSYLEDSRQAVELALEYDHVYCSIGFHPHDSKRWNANSAKVEESLSKNCDQS